MTFTLRSITAVLVGVALASLGACSKETSPRTEIVIVVDSDLEAPEEIDQVSITAVRDGSSTMMLERSGPIVVDDSRRLPLTVGLLHTAGSLGPIRVTARGLKGTTEVVSQVAIISFVKNKRMMLRMNLVRACLPQNVSPACDNDETCIDGACSSMERDVTEWREPDGGQLEVTDADVPDVDASTDASTDAGIEAGSDAATDDDAGVETDAGSDSGPICISQPEQCNDADDDCDDNVDEGFDLTSIEHCGSCSNACPTNLLNARSICDSGTCAIECLNNTDDCDGMLLTGCETNLTSPTDCGTCENACGAGTPFCGFNGITLTCVGACGALTLCDGTSCVDTQTDPLHCGGCDPCSAQTNASAACNTGSCDYSCFDGYASCSDNNNGNGCETNLRTDPAHCDGCDNACTDRANSSPRCVNGTCDIACDNGFTDCDSMITTGCEVNTNGDATNCGSCNNACPARTNAATTCTGGTCSFTCNAGRGNCDNNPANGCETNTNTSKGNCGACAGSGGDVCTALEGCCNGACRLLSLGC